MCVLGGIYGVMVTIRRNGDSDPSSKSWMRLFAFPIALMPLGKV